MNYKATNWFVFITILVLSGLNAFQFTMNTKWNTDYDDFQRQKALTLEIIDVNGKNFKDFAKLTELAFNNSDTIMRYAHFHDNHDPSIKQALVCPECGEAGPQTIPKEAFNEDPIPMDDIPETLDQVLDDAYELNGNIGSLIFTMINMDVGLRVHLELLRNPDLDRKDLHKQIYKPLSEYGIENFHDFGVKTF